MMKTFFGSLRHVFAAANKLQMLWGAAILLVLIALAILHHKWRGDHKKMRLWRLLCLLPLLLCAVHFYFNVFGATDLLGMFLPLYVIAVLALLPIPFAKRKHGYRITASIVGVLIALCGFYFCGTAPNCHNETRSSYTDSFRALVRHMNSEYILKEWKEVDFVALEAKYLPAVEAAEKEQNPAKFEEAVTAFCNALHDGHVWVSGNFDSSAYKTDTEQHGYGFATIGLDSGEVIAVCTEDPVQALGIKDGTVITKWNGVPILQAAEENVPDLGQSVLTNDDFLKLMNVCTSGGETAEVSFLDESGAEQTVTLQEVGNLTAHHEAFHIFSHEFDFETPAELYESNFSYKMLDDKCGYIRLLAEGTANGLQDTLAYLQDDHKWVRELFRARLGEMKSQGMEYLVVDLRDNMGGFDEIGCALCDLLTDRDWYGQGLGIRKNGQYTCVSDHGIHGTGEFADLQVVALTNYGCASAGDGTSLYLSKLPNVTLAGITDPCGCNQETGGVCVLAGGAVIVGYPTGLILDENSVPNVDTRADRISRNPVEVQIPFDWDAAMQMFRDGEDYELNWAMQYLERTAA